MEKQNDTPDKKPQDTENVGLFLKYTRLNQKKTLDAVSKALCIRKIYIKSIEDSNFDELPPVPYGIGFIRSYAEYLGLNSEWIVQRYKEETMPQKKKEVSVSTNQITAKPNRRQILAGIAVVLCVYLVWLLPSYNSENEINQQALSVMEIQADEDILSSLPNLQTLHYPEESIITPEEMAGTANDALEDNLQINVTNESYYSDSPEENLSETDSRIVVKFKGESWFEIRDDSKIYITGTFEKGYTYNVPNQPGLRISVGRFNNVDIYVDGQLTTVVRPHKQINIALDPFLNH